MRQSTLLIGVACCLALVLSTEAAASVCSSQLAVTSTYSCAGATVQLTNPACFTPTGVPNASAVVAFTSSTPQGLVLFSEVLTTFRSIVIPSGTTLSMMSGAIQVTECLQVSGTLRILASTVSVANPSAFLPDPSVPQGTDCQTVSNGFTARVCGPGQLYVAVGGYVVASGLYASIWNPAEVAGSLALLNKAFLWGNTTIATGGTFTADTVYFHGELHVLTGAEATVQQVRADKWNIQFAKPQLVIVNHGSFTFQTTKESAPPGIAMMNWDVVSTYDSLAGDATLQFVNHGTVTFDARSKPMSAPFGGVNFNLINYGTAAWSGESQWFRSTGSTINYGLMTANAATVYMSDYASHGGTLNTTNGGYFWYGNGAGADTKLVLQCDRDRAELRTKPQKQAAPELTVRTAAEKVNDEILEANRIALASKKKVSAVKTAVATNCTTENDCAYYDCCVNGVCVPTNCYMDYGSDPCCGCCGEPNAPCSGSSHGPYCGGSMFSWEVDSDCIDGVEFVDRYDLEHMRRRLAPHLVDALPRFGRHRYLFEAHTTSFIVGDGTGAVLFNEPLEVRDGATVVVRDGGVLRNLIDGNQNPFVAPRERKERRHHSSSSQPTVSVEQGGEYGAGIRSVYDDSVDLVVREGGTLYVSKYSQVRLHKHHHVRVEPHATIIVDGKIIADAKSKEPLLVMGGQSANFVAKDSGKKKH